MKSALPPVKPSEFSFSPLGDAHCRFTTFVSGHRAPLKPIRMKKIWDQILRYMFLKKKDPNAPHTTYVKMMHGMNRISILLFLICVVILLIRFIKYLLH